MNKPCMNCGNMLASLASPVIYPAQGHLMLCSDITQGLVNLIEAHSTFHRQLAAQVSQAYWALLIEGTCTETHTHSHPFSPQVILD